ncbi:MAG: hypothetical protein L7S72_11495 [Flavobacteriales bacterium]|nr:hypothetical protein [Flavobacteriales bacterium]
MKNNIVVKPKKETLTPQGSWQEDHVDKLIEQNEMNYPSEVNKQFVRTKKPVVFNKLATSLITSGVGVDDPSNKNVDNYYNQIKTNAYVSIKGIFLVCRDLFDAKIHLTKQDFERLCEKLNFSYSTQLKYLAIGGDFRLFKMFNSGKLPTSWTTQYELSKLEDEQFVKVLNHKDISCETSWSKIKELIEFKEDKEKKSASDFLNFGNLEVQKEKVTQSNFDKFQNALKKFMSDFDFMQISLNHDFEKTIKEMIEKRNAKSIELNEVTAKDTSKAVA